ncbi:phage-related DNA primase [Trabulsiella guamensis ATCC 49490]|uniref:Phage-related DNA primase n=1 Tax=Trabulsiella guamensis ATCC 49490 TaxID=1005994 RepID=A0A084ZPA1_9ENTR|nr:phage-related DNA primase [Trabulsiella guamensis ATCC 49490]
MATELLACDLDAWRVSFPPGMDANDYTLISSSPESVLALQQVRWLGSVSGHGVVFSHESPSVPEVTASQQSPSSLIVAESAVSQAAMDVVVHESTY